MLFQAIKQMIALVVAKYHINTIRNLNPKTGVQTSTFFSKRISDGKLIGCIKIHLKLVVVACDKDNIALASTAKSCGGVLANEFEEDGVIKQHYVFNFI